MSIGIIFPGQGSQSIGMLSTLADTYTIVRDTYAEASELLGIDTWQIAQQGPKENLNNTVNTQPILLTAEVAIWRIWQERNGIKPVLMAGHSLGEYSALVCAEAISFTDAVTLVADRAKFMQQAVPQGQGAMAAILGLDEIQVQKICNEILNNKGIVEAVNINAPGQIVIAGHTSAVTEAGKLAKTAGAKRVLPLPISVPSHCALMKPAAEQLTTRLTQIQIQPPKIPIVHNATVQTTQDPEQIRKLLAMQLYNPVRWIDTIQKFSANKVTNLLEFGPGKVLTGLNKRIDPNIKVWPLYDPETLDQALKEIPDVT